MIKTLKERTYPRIRVLYAQLAEPKFHRIHFLKAEPSTLDGNMYEYTTSVHELLECLLEKPEFLDCIRESAKERMIETARQYFEIRGGGISFDGEKCTIRVRNLPWSTIDYIDCKILVLRDFWEKHDIDKWDVSVSHFTTNVITREDVIAWTGIALGFDYNKESDMIVRARSIRSIRT